MKAVIAVASLAASLRAVRPARAISALHILTGVSASCGFALPAAAQTAPTANTSSPSSISVTSAVLGGSVPSDGGSSVTSRGVVYSAVNSTPTIGGSNVTNAPNGSGTGTFSAAISGLTANTQYTVRAYATNGVGTSYGAGLTFRTTTPALNTTTSQTNVACNGGSNGVAALLVSGGATPYSYLWSTGATTSTITGLRAGAYSVTVTDSTLGTPQTVTRSITIVQPSALVANASSTNASGAGTNDGTATVTASGGAGGYSYSWNSGQSTRSISGLAPGSYTVTVTDANSCPRDATTTVSAPIPADTTPPTVNSITPGSTGPSASTTETYTVVFSEAVTGVDASDFVLTSTGTAGGTIASVSGSGSTYTVAINAITGTGTLRLDLKPGGTGIQDSASNPIGSGYTSGSSRAVAQPAPPAPVPTLSEWAMILFGTVLAGGAALYVQRRRLTA